MKPLARNLIARPFALLLALMLALLVLHGGANAQERPTFSQQQLEQMLAPIALYPDPLLSQILMASTYPLEVVEAARWSRSRTQLFGEDAVRAAENENWDPSVKSLLAFPQVLARMEENLQWMQTLGDAFLGQEPEVMDTVQELRRRAQVAGNLRSDERQLIVETGPALAVQPADPQIIYVPYYDSRVVYGPWWWPDYSPVYWRAFPGYSVRPGLASSFFWGPSIRISVGYFFGACDWSRRRVRVVRSTYYYRDYYGVAGNQRASAVHRDHPPRTWQHDPVHRRGIAYRGVEVQQRFAGARTRLDSDKRLDREDVRRHDQARALSFPTSNRRSDASRPAVQVGVPSNGSTRSTQVQPVVQQHAQPFPSSSRKSEPLSEIRRTVVQPVMATPVPAQQVEVTRPHSGTNARADQRDRAGDFNRGDRRGDRLGDRREAAESRQAARPANVVPQMQSNRGNATSPHPVIRQEAQRGVERRHEAHSNPDPRKAEQRKIDHAAKQQEKGRQPADNFRAH